MDCLSHGRRTRLLGPMVTAMDLHGGNIYQAARAQQCRPMELCDFSASINPLGPSIRVLRALRHGLRAIAHYPDPEACDVRLALSKQFGLPPDWFLIGNGSAELIDLLPRGLGISRAVVVGPTFTEYEAAMQRTGGLCTYCLADRQDDYRPPIDRLIMRLQKDRRKNRNTEAVFLCNPNSPTGRMVTKTQLLSLIDVVRMRGGWAIIDEAFAEFAPDHSLMDVLPRYPRLMVLRSGTKFYAIPGLRLGYLAGHPAALRQVHRRQVPWSVNALAQVAAVAALEDTRYREISLRYIDKERVRLQSALRAIPGVRVFPSAVNFLLLEVHGAVTAAGLGERLRGTGILIRDCSNVPGLNRRTLRIAVKRRRDNERLCRALKEILHD